MRYDIYIYIYIVRPERVNIYFLSIFLTTINLIALTNFRRRQDFIFRSEKFFGQMGSALVDV